MIDHRLPLQAEGHATVQAEVLASWWASGRGTEFYVRIPTAQHQKLKAGVRYQLAVGDQRKGWVWRVEDGVGLSGR